MKENKSTGAERRFTVTVIIRKVFRGSRLDDPFVVFNEVTDPQEAAQQT